MDKHTRLGALKFHQTQLTAELVAANTPPAVKQKLSKQLKNVEAKIEKIKAEIKK